MNELLKRLVQDGCYPSIYYRGGGIWRAHVNAAGDCWEESDTPFGAMQMAVEQWVERGKPMDGMAATVAAEAARREA